MANVKPIQKRSVAVPKPQSRINAAWIGFIISLVGATILGLWRLSTVTANLAGPADLATKHTLFLDSPWWKSIAHLNGLFFLVLHGTFAISRSLFFFRLTSVLFGVLSAALVYFLVNHWHGYRIALLTTAAYISSFGFLVVTHQSTTLTSQLPLAIGLLAAVITLDTWDSIWSIAALIISIAYALYVPGGIWLALTASVLTFSDLKETFQNIETKWKLLLGLLLIVAIFPIGYRLGAHYSLTQTLQWLGYGLHGRLSALKALGTNLFKVPADLFAYSLNLPRTMQLGHLPLLPVAESILIFVGLYCYGGRIKNYNWRCLLIFIAVAWLVVGFGVLSVFALLPLIVLTLGGGLTYLLRQWYVVFPRNPIARYAGLTVMSLVILFSCFFAARSFFVAWSNNPAQSSLFAHKL